MATGISTQSIALPTDVASEIIQKTQEASAVMRLAKRTTVPGRGTTFPVITGDPEASWVKETEKAKTSRGTMGTKILTPYKLSVIVPFSDEFKEDLSTLYDALVQRIPGAMSKKFDATVFGAGDAPGSNFDTMTNCTAQEIGTDAYGGLVAADADVADHDGILNGYVLSPKAKSILLTATDKNGRPLFINSVAEGAIPMILGQTTYMSKGAYISGTPDVVGFAGDWTQAIYGVAKDVTMSISNQATITDGSGTINLFEQGMLAVKAEMRVGFVCDTTVFNKLTKAN